MTVGQVLWSPRQDSWTAGLAPTGMEGLFFAIGSSRALLAPLGDYLMGVMNGKYNPNCPSCRDSYGHFCSDVVISDIEGNNTQQLIECWSVQERCGILLENHAQTCPTTCNECPNWEHTNSSTFWYILVGISIASPLLGKCMMSVALYTSFFIFRLIKNATCLYSLVVFTLSTKSAFEARYDIDFRNMWYLVVS